jgi:hypothetical protein
LLYDDFGTFFERFGEAEGGGVREVH